MNPQTSESGRKNWRIIFIDPAVIEPNPFFGRTDLEATLDESFIESVTKDLKQPVTVRLRQRANKRYQLALGHRRWYAYTKKSIKIPAIIRDLSDEDMVRYAWDDTFQFEAHEPEEEARLILTRLDMELKDLPEYKVFGEPGKLLKAMDSQRERGVFPRRRGKTDQKHPGGRPQKHPNVPPSLVECVERIFSELPESRKMTWVTFYNHLYRLMDTPADVWKNLDEKEVPTSSSAKEAIVRVDDELARKMTLDWASKRKKVSVRVLDKRARVFNKCTKGLAQITNMKEKERIIQLVLEKCPHPKDVQLEIEKVAPRPGKEPKEKPIDTILDGVYVGRDSKDMHDTPTESVRLIITSPPYFNKVEFEDYLSRCKTPDDFFRKVEPIIAECYRVLMPGGKLCVNWGEPIGEGEGADYEENILAHRWVELCRNIGLRLWGRITWWKDPPSYAFARDRVKWDDAVHTDGKIHLNSELILVFRKPGPTPEGKSGLSHEEFVQMSNAVWRIPGAREGPRGLATFPDELVERLVKYYSFPGDLVLDPFLGTGTTVKVARQLGRRGVGYEIGRWLAPTIRKTLSKSKARADGPGD